MSCDQCGDCSTLCGQYDEVFYTKAVDPDDTFWEDQEDLDPLWTGTNGGTHVCMWDNDRIVETWDNNAQKIEEQLKAADGQA
jgi:hypothetical protein